MLVKKVICLIISVLIGSFIFIGCSSADTNISQSEDDAVWYSSRERVERFASRNGFGYGRTDAETLVLLYVYNSPNFAEKYGTDFCVDNIGGSDTTSTFLVSWLYEGTGAYYVEINGDRWRVSVVKDYFEKWEIVDCYQEQEE